MKHKRLKGIANNLSVILISERSHSLLEDVVDQIAGSFVVDFLDDSSLRSSPVLADIHSWLDEQLHSIGANLLSLQKAEVVVSFNSDLIPTDRERLLYIDLKAESTLTSEERTFVGFAENTIWYKRQAV